MILIISQERYETSTDDVIDWIGHLKGNFIRINGEDIYSDKGVPAFSLTTQAGGLTPWKALQSKKINIAWFRRWSAKRYLDKLHLTSGGISGHMIEAYKTLVADDATLRSYFLYNLRVKKWLSFPPRVTVNKLIVLDMAQKAGLAVPDTIVCGNKKELEQFLQQGDRVITKDLTNPFVLQFPDGDKYMSFTKEVDQQFMIELPESFAPSLFQKMIPKSYEIRTFFLGKKFYSMAIFSQQSEQTSVDFRNYNAKKPNRTVPYKLPAHIEQRLRKLMRQLKLDTGSIDIIRTEGPEGYIFLEVNPIGQFGMTSRPCNYNLEKIIAQYLIQQDQDGKE